MAVRRKAPQEPAMSEIHSDDGRTVEKLGREPWVQIDWAELFERTAGKENLPLSTQTLAQVLSARYDCTPGLAREVLQLAVNHGELLSLEVTIGDMSWTYYFNRTSPSGSRSIELIVSTRDFYDTPSDFVPETISKENLKSKYEGIYSHADTTLFDRVINSLEYMIPLLVDGDEVRLHPALTRYVLLRRSHEAISDAIAPCDTAEEGPAFERVLGELGKYSEAKNELTRR
ncbi:hypothetical protein C443_16576 [Haloarcula argentinensis DSM 12282]|nr:hypothetical protein C443_16576 [Haloarcula argentinensis DSM 12282]